jgi:hypothetical protein
MPSVVSFPDPMFDDLQKQEPATLLCKQWIPAFAGMTAKGEWQRKGNDRLLGLKEISRIGFGKPAKQDSRKGYVQIAVSLPFSGWKIVNLFHSSGQ